MDVFRCICSCWSSFAAAVIQHRTLVSGDGGSPVDMGLVLPVVPPAFRERVDRTRSTLVACRRPDVLP